MEILVTLGSLAKGTREHAQALVSAGVLPLLLDGLRSGAPQLRTPLLRCLRSLLLQLPESADDLCRDPSAVPLLTRSVTGAARDDECAATILAILCRGAAQQELLAASGAVDVSAALLASDTASVRLPSLRLLASLCYRHRAISERVARCTLAGRPVPDVLTLLTARDQPSGVQLEASRCLCYIHRSGASALPATDPRLIYRALPCLVRMCATYQTLEERVLAADTLGYLTETDIGKCLCDDFLVGGFGSIDSLLVVGIGIMGYAYGDNRHNGMLLLPYDLMQPLSCLLLNEFNKSILHNLLNT